MLSINNFFGIDLEKMPNHTSIYKMIFSILLICTFTLIGCSEEDNVTYTQSELEAFLIRDSKNAVYIFEDKDLMYNFDFEKSVEGNIGEYHRSDLKGSNDKDSDFIWELKPNGNGAIITMSFEEGGKRIKLRMGFMDQDFTTIHVGQNGEFNVESGTKKLWKLNFKPEDDPYK